jgi:nicotinamidase-related amidase
MSTLAIDPDAALVLIDLQRGITAGELAPHDAETILRNADRLARAFRDAGRPVVHVRVSFAADGADAPPGRTAVGRPGQRRPEGWDELDERVHREPGDLHVVKRNWGAFHGTDLDVQLRRRGVGQVVIAGIATTMGVESTARAAHEHGYHVVVVEDASGGRDADEHVFTIERVVPRLGHVATTDEVVAALPGG